MTTISLNDGWWLCSSEELPEAMTGDTLSRVATVLEGGRRICVPATVLGALVEAGVYEDPFFGTNLLKIPGQGPAATNFSNHPMPDDSPFKVSWWYVRDIEVPPDAPAHLSLRLDGINYRANLWCNGELIADSKQLVGAYRDFELDLTAKLRRDGPNRIAIEVFPPEPDDLAITWVDWNPSPPDKNMGIWREVWLDATGPVAIAAPHVTTRLEGQERARLTIAADLVNRSSEPQAVRLQVRVLGHLLTRALELRPGETQRVELGSEQHPELAVDEPQLWWPRQFGPPTLHDLTLTAHVQETQISDSVALRFGIREVTAELTDDGHSVFRINGQRILIKGAGWATDLFLRHDPASDLEQIEYVKALNLNTIRFEGMLERNAFLERCDEEGLLVIAGWCCCDHWEKWDNWKDEDYEVSAESLRSQLRRVRRHPCLISWWYGSDFPPPPRVEQRYLDVARQEHWPNPTHSSAANKPTAVTGKSGLKMSGPYDYVPPNYWLEDVERGGAFGFATEICPGPAVPPLESLRKMLPQENLWPIDDVWRFHAGGQEFHNIDLFTQALNGRFGEVSSVEQFASLSQLLCYEAQRAMFEGFRRNKYGATGVIQWMLQNSWPSLIWHLYDYYLRPAGGFFGTQRGCEPVHAMFAWDNRGIYVVNDTLMNLDDLELSVHAFTTQGRSLLQEQLAVSVGADDKTRVLNLPELHIDEAFFLELRLAGTDIEPPPNLYWLPSTPDEMDHSAGNWFHTPITKYGDLQALRRLPKSEVSVSLRECATVTGREALQVEVKNPTERLAFFVEVRLSDDAGDDVLPVIWSDNYISLAPGERRILEASMPGGTRRGRSIQAHARGINVAPTSASLRCTSAKDGLPVVAAPPAE